MSGELYMYNSLSRKKEFFQPLREGQVGMYVCGPTVYSDVHLGNCRTFVSFDIIYRYLLFKGFKVRYIRNITDVGHLLDDGEDRISRGARLEKLEPMEVVQKYTNGFHEMMRIFNILPPSIEPRASGHIPEQIEMIEEILKNGYGYEMNGSVYFDTLKFAEDTSLYGKLSGRVIEELMVETRDDLKKQDEKKHPSDFAIWMKAQPEHIMRWNSPWSVGFPGWHLECSVMSTKYLGEKFDIHGGGNDLKFPHHENEIAQNYASCKCTPANYWLHANMLLMNGKKMSKSDGNTISPHELFSGNSEHISKGYNPMVVRFFMLQSHYRSTLDISDEALQAAEKGYKRLMEAFNNLESISVEGSHDAKLNKEFNALLDGIMDDMNDDFNTPKALAKMFEIVSKINGLKDKKIDPSMVSSETIERVKKEMKEYLFGVFGLKDGLSTDSNGGPVEGLMDLIIALRQDARENKNWHVADMIRDQLQELNIKIKDGKEGTTWSLN